MFQIETPYGARYRVDEATGNVIARAYRRMDFEKMPGNGSWVITGAVSTHPFAGRKVTPLANLVGQDIRYKNGNPRFTITDLDHGTSRVWGNTEHHGIYSVHRIPD